MANLALIFLEESAACLPLKITPPGHMPVRFPGNWIVHRNLDDFHLLEAMHNSMKSIDDFWELLTATATFTIEYRKTHSISLVGDFYVFALIKIAHPILVKQLWGAALAVLEPIKIRPIRRIKKFIHINASWKLAVPFPLDCPGLLASKDISIDKQTLARSLPIFVRLRKKNYVVAVSYMLGLIANLERCGGDAYASFLRHLPQLSSEDLEVWHSRCREMISHQDTSCDAHEEYERQSGE
ncbi:hypothetical protein BDK51DRAFT_27989 [Blyttiomyces helicus]|uniref:Uncharacterized protein n=1 Tax=Blyttiomyces helicus TaxID=388810 RepID=A0A4P9WIM0_9FUNG|nr:hypothetical protein BDK51DRAFT_27989 [Blyttiomyces helicus]|eukprot:RKO92721.1 hypothetical protein BDK51DRAFT_27989 [Blyttiomyces helicus]